MRFGFETLLDPPQSKADDSEDYDGFLRARPRDMKGSSLLEADSESTNNVRGALPMLKDVAEEKQASGALDPHFEGTKDLRGALRKVNNDDVREKQDGKQDLFSVGICGRHGRFCTI